MTSRMETLALLVSVAVFLGLPGNIFAGQPSMLWDRAPDRTMPNGLPILHSQPGAPVSIFIDLQFQSVNGKLLPFTRSVGPISAWHVWLSEFGHPKNNPAGLFWVVNDIDRIADAIVKGAKTYADANYAGDGFRPDEHENDIAHATPMAQDSASGVWQSTGIIERYADKDVFSFDWPGGTSFAHRPVKRSSPSVATVRQSVWPGKPTAACRSRLRRATHSRSCFPEEPND